jgi:signal recognition particle receptor subunit beta
MPFLDQQRDSLIVRIVYDGPPFSGKTTTLRALGAGSGRTVETPEEHDGRTLYFDWLDYTAGSFDGRPIRCQIVSVPGQRGLAKRRSTILQEADAVVFVADTGSLGMELSLKYAADLAAIIAHQEAPRPGVVVQANKRDAPDANSMVDVERAFRSVGIEGSFVEATAHTGSGVREAFVCAVRLALVRAREMLDRGTLAIGRPAVDSSQDLLTSLVGLEAAPRVVEAARNAAAAASRDEAWTLPNPAVSSGLIWPPVDGRQYLHEALAGHSIDSRDDGVEGLFVQSSSGWCMHLRPQDVFDDQNEGRMALASWARLHAQNTEFLSDQRCLVLSPAGPRWHLWQIFGSKRSLLESLVARTTQLGPRDLAEHLLGLGRTLLAAAAAFGRATMPLPMTLETVGTDALRPIYIAKSPGFDSEVDAPLHSSVSSVDTRGLLAQIAAPAEASMDGWVCQEVVVSLLQRAGTSAESGDLCAALVEALSSTSPVAL